MDDGAGIIIGVLVAVLAGGMGAMVGANLVRDEAIAANVACYKVMENSSAAKFTWNCKERS